ncbi:MAG: amidase domain-containing protein [Oscillospiraceae bacterium]|nr:amidase domain-containing protein [Oscillospiraceae bacterium]
MKKKRKILITAVTVLCCVIAAASVIKAIPAEYENITVPVYYNTDSNQTTYNREKVREYARFACTDPDNGTFRYLDRSNGDTATDCANFVSQCIYAGGYPMTDEWYMKKYSDKVPKIRRILDKITGKAAMIWHDYTGKADTYGEYTEMNYLWTYPWTCAGVQSQYGENYFFGDHYTVSDYSSLKKIVLDNNIQTGDVIYQGTDKHHVMIITNVDEDGTLYISSHNPVLYDHKLDEVFWEKGGFGGTCQLYKVKDRIE